ncbi:YvrJ family protein [Lysinibacillus fusiformis]|nr:YvrJ family protein [Lysinibacillus fusiformis]
MEEWVRIIQEIGFPIVVSFYLLYRIEAKLEAIHAALVSMNHQ